MSNVAKLKKKALEFEQKKQFDKALALYVQILDESGGPGEEADVALFNRVGDLMLRHNQVARALDYYERAVDLYAEGGFFNNAIALCNKILRNSPGRSSIYYKLGKISAKKGFASDAKQNFLEYADRMQKAGQMDEAFRALKEFADLCPDQDDVRLMLAEQLSKRERKGEAMEQLQSLYEKFESEGRTLEARATADRMRAIDPNAEPTKAASQAQAAPKPGELVFLDVDYGDEPVRKPARAPHAPVARPQPAKPSAPPARPAAPPPVAEPAARTHVPPPEPASTTDPRLVAQAPPPPVEEVAPEPLPEIDTSTRAAEQYTELSDVGDQLPMVQGFETGMPGMDQDLGAGIQPDNVLGIERTSVDSGFGAGLDGFASHDAGSMFTTFDVAEVAAPEDTAPRPEHDLVLPGELPMLDLPDFDSLDSGPEIPLIMPDDPMPPRRASREILADLEPPLTKDGQEPPIIELEAFSFDIQKEDSALLSVDEPDSPEGGDPGAFAPPSIGFEHATPSLDGPGQGRSASLAAKGDSVEQLARELAANDADYALRRQLGEAFLERGDRERGLQELELAMIGFERSSDYDSARSVADEIIRLDPNSVRHHQKRVQYAFQANDTPRLVEAYLELADALFRGGQADKARTVYQRVLELAPNDIRAQAALSAFVDAAQAPAHPAPPARGASGAVRRYSANTKRASAPPPAAPKPARPPRVVANDEEFVNLGDLLRDDEVPKSTRMVVEEQAPSGDEQADFADMLKQFKRGIAENVDEEDHQSHYDLGVAFKEMGLLDEAIAEFQKALRGTEQRVRTYEALGQCFMERSQFDVAATILQRALADGRAGDEQLVGVLYLLGYANEALDRYEDALSYYQRVFSVDIQFRDVADRIRALERVAQ